MNIVEATRAYELWLAKHIPLIDVDLDFKHEQMRLSSFAFLRATFYRWSQQFAKVCPELADAPKVLAVGDLHAENFGTWRDSEGRLVWGVNDFDEAAWFPFTIDLVRLAVSLQLAIEANHLSLEMNSACDAVEEAYRKAIGTGGGPFVLAESHPGLRRMASGATRDPLRFWNKMNVLPTLLPVEKPEAESALADSLPIAGLAYELRSRRAGLGSLGRHRFVVLADFQGGRIAREAKAVAPSAAYWSGVADGPEELWYLKIVQGAVRCQDPFVGVSGRWLVRRLAPDCSRIEMSDLPDERDELRLVEAMGKETANIHLGSREAIPSVLKHLDGLPHKWLRKACEAMADEVRRDFKDFQRT
jgi:hypothetical protein